MVSVRGKMPEILRQELDINSAVESLEQRASFLEKEFAVMLKNAEDLLQATTRYIDKEETEQECWNLMEAILSGSGDSRDILDHVRVFFQFVLAQMKMNDADILDLKMLWHLHDNQDIRHTFLTAVNHFGFGKQDLKNLKVLLAVTYKLQMDVEKETGDVLADSIDVEKFVFNDTEDEEIEHFLKESRHVLGNVRTENIRELLRYIGDKPADVKESTKDLTKIDSDEQTEIDKDQTEITGVENEIVQHADSQKTNQDINIDEQIIDGSICMNRTHDSISEHMDTQDENFNHNVKEDTTRESSTKSTNSHPLKKVAGFENTEMPKKTSSKHLPSKKRLRKTLHAWGVDTRMQETIMKIMFTVLWMLNVGRQEKNLSIVKTSGEKRAANVHC